MAGTSPAMTLKYPNSNEAGHARVETAPDESQRHATRFTQPQLLSETHSPRSKRKRSIGADELSARMRHSPTAIHWKPHFSKIRRDAGLVTRAPACSVS